MMLMTWIQLGPFVVVMTLLVRPLGAYMARVFSGQPTPLDPFLCPVERTIYRAAGVDPSQELNGRGYATVFLGFSLVGTGLLYAIPRLQPQLPWFDPVTLRTPMTPTWRSTRRSALRPQPPGRPMPVRPP